MCSDLLGQLSEIPCLEVGNQSSKAFCELLLLGNPQFNNIAIELILEATISYILSTKEENELLKLLAAHHIFYVCL